MRDEPDDSLDRSLRGFLDDLASDAPAPGGGSAAAACAAMAAALLGGVARLSSADWPDAGTAMAQASKLRARAAPLIELDAHAFDSALRELAGEDRREDEDGDENLKRALARAAEVPLAIAAVGADAAELAATVARGGNPAFRADAVAAAVLAEAASRLAVALIEANLATPEGDPRAAAADAHLKRASAARKRAENAS